MAKQIFINLAVKDLQKSMDFEWRSASMPSFWREVMAFSCRNKVEIAFRGISPHLTNCMTTMASKV